MPHSAETPLPPNDTFETQPSEEDVLLAEKIRQEILVSARQLLYAFQPSASPELRAEELHRMSQKVKHLKDVARSEREGYAIGVLEWANHRMPENRQHSLDSARSALEHHFRIQAVVETALRPVSDTGAIMLKLGRQTVGLFHKPQK